MSASTPLTSPRVHISAHPLVASKLTQLRLHDLGAKDFREGIKSIGCDMPCTRPHNSVLIAGRCWYMKRLEASP